jgi:hypothetical protein
MQDYLQIAGYCPISNDNKSILSVGLNQNIPMNFLGYEVLANSEIKEFGGQEIQKLTHELLIRLYLIQTQINSSELIEDKMLEVLVQTLNSYIVRSIAKTGHSSSVAREFDLNSLAMLLAGNKQVKILLKSLQNYIILKNNSSHKEIEVLHQATVFDQSNIGLQTVLRKIEYCAYFLLVSSVNGIFDYFKINHEEHLSLLTAKKQPYSSADYIALCFEPFNRKIDYGLKKWGVASEMAKVDNWLTDLLPDVIIRAPYPTDPGTIKVLNKFKTMMNKLSLTKPTEQEEGTLIEMLVKDLSDSDIRATITLEAFGLIILLCWKAGLSWVPIVGELVPFVDDGPVGRVMGVGIATFLAGYLASNGTIEMKLVPQAFIATPTSRKISILFFGLMLGGIFAV